MSYHDHNQYPFSAEYKRRRLVSRREKRAAAAYDFLRNFVIAALACWVLLTLMAILDGRVCAW